MLNSKQISYLRSLSHNLSPVVFIGNKGVTPAVLNEIELSIKAHELIKIQIQENSKEKRTNSQNLICQKINAQAINLIGKQIIIYKANEKTQIILP
jgi:RNA-binding protein